LKFVRWLVFSKKSGFSCFLLSFLSLQGHLGLCYFGFALGILHWFGVLLGSLRREDFLCGWHLLLHHGLLLSLLESVNLGCISILNQDHLLIIAWDHLTVWKNLRMVVHQENVLLEWVTTLQGHHGCLLGWGHRHLWDWLWHVTLILFLTAHFLLDVASFIFFLTDDIMKIKFVLGGVAMVVAVSCALLFLFAVACEERIVISDVCEAFHS
jgi:hypothetical protein